MPEFQNKSKITNKYKEIELFLSEIMSVKMAVVYPIFANKKFSVAVYSKNKFQILEFQESELSLINDFFKKYTGQVVFSNVKEIYKQFVAKNLIFPSKFVDLELGIYLENSETKQNLVEYLETKFAIQLDSEVIENSNDNEQGEDIFGDFEVSLDVGKIEILVTHFYLLSEHFLVSFTPTLLDLWQKIESPLAIVLAKMEMVGVYINKPKLHETADSLRVQSLKLEQEIFQLLGSDQINLSSPSQLADILALKGFQLNKKGSSGKLSVDKFVLDELALVDESGVIQKILEYRTLVKLLSTYTENLISQLDSDSRLHCQFNQFQAATGRISSSNPNLQNIPIRNQEYGGMIRSCFSTPEGRVLVRADYSQIELRLLAHFTSDPVLKEAFELNQDIHRRTAAEIFEISIDQVTSAQRSLGKTLNFALLYQQGSFATARQLGIEVKQAKQFIEKYFNAFATVKPFMQQVLEKARECGYTESLSGRRRYFKHLNSGNKMLMRESERAAFNMVLQGSNADLIKIAMNDIDKKMLDYKLDGLLILQVHDELVFEVAKKDAQVVSKLVQDTMSNPPVKLNVALFVDTKIGNNWAEC